MGEPDVEQPGIGDEVFGQEKEKEPPQPGGQDNFIPPPVGGKPEEPEEPEKRDDDGKEHKSPFAKFEFDEKDKRLVECNRLDRKVDDTLKKVDNLLSEIEEL